MFRTGRVSQSRSTFVAVSLLAVAPALLSCASPGLEEAPATTEILWDEWGVPHVFAASAEELFYAFGWAQARSHGDLVLRLYGESRGRAAEYWGQGERGAENGENLDKDRWVLTMGIPGRAAEWYQAQPASSRAFLDAFAEGFNDYAAAHPEALADEVERVLPVSGVDALAHGQRVIQFTFVVDPRTVAGAAEAIEPEAEIKGSNAWAIAPSKSASGRAILVANPHLPWSDLFTWFEAQLTSPEVDAYGAALVGTPFLGIAFNDFLGWSHTVNTHDGFDLYELTLRDGGYVFDGEVHGFEVEEHILKVRGENGEPQEEALTVRHSLHGPVVAEEDDKALALKVVGLEAFDLVDQYWRMARATSFAEFEAAQRALQMPMFTTMYADRDGEIYHLFGGETPERPRGDWETWSRPVPGDSSEWLWSGVHAFDELPALRNPASGWLQNANDPPWTTTFPAAMEADDFPAYLAPRFMHFRAQRSARMLAEDDDGVTFEEAVAYKLSNRMELADRILDDLDAAVAEKGRGLEGEAARRAMAVLSAWDRTADAKSRGGVLFAEVARRLRRQGIGFAREWSEETPRDTPDGLADPAAAVRVLAEAAAHVTEKHGAVDVAWGDVYRLRLGSRDLPANGGPGSLGVFRVVNYAPDDKHYRAYGGDSFVAVVEFSDPPRARVLLTYGNSSQPGSPHNGDQLELFSRKELRKAWRDRAEIEAHLEEREALSR